jgi:hypothetical protein
MQKGATACTNTNKQHSCHSTATPHSPYTRAFSTKAANQSRACTDSAQQRANAGLARLWCPVCGTTKAIKHTMQAVST